MWTYEKAEKIMEAWVEQATVGKGMIIKEYCVAKSYGWFFSIIQKNGLFREKQLMGFLEAVLA